MKNFFESFFIRLAGTLAGILVLSVCVTLGWLITGTKQGGTLLGVFALIGCVFIFAYCSDKFSAWKVAKHKDTEAEKQQDKQDQWTKNHEKIQAIRKEMPIPTDIKSYMKLATGLSLILKYECDIYGYPYVSIYATADYYDEMVKYLLEKNKKRNPTEETPSESSADAQYNFWYPLARATKQDNQNERSLAFQLILLRRLGNIYQEIHDIYDTLFKECFPNCKSYNEIKTSEYYDAYERASQELEW